MALLELPQAMLSHRAEFDIGSHDLIVTPRVGVIVGGIVIGIEEFEGNIIYQVEDERGDIDLFRCDELEDL